MKNFKIILLTLGTMFTAGNGLGQMPIHPDVLQQIREGGIPAPRELSDPGFLKRQGINAGWTDPALIEERKLNKNEFVRSYGPKTTPTGIFKVLALLVDFSDNTSSVMPTFFDTRIFGSGTNSVRNYYLQVSYGILQITTVNLPSSLGWKRAPQAYAYYVNGQRGFGSYPRNAQRLTEDAVNMADPFVDYSQYDNNGDGYVDALFIVHAGNGYENTGDTNKIHSHQWSTVFPPNVDGVTVFRYTMVPEYLSSPGDQTIGVYVHEFAHAVFGLPDLYDYGYDSKGLGDWSLMASGSWNGPGYNGSSPSHPDAWSRIQMGYLTPVNVTTRMIEEPIPAVENTPSAYRLAKNGQMGDEYFLVENRQRTGFDYWLPAAGLLIYHIDETQFGNNHQWYPGRTDSGHYKVALEQADGLWQLERNINAGDISDQYPGYANNRTFSANTTPDSRDYSFKNTGVSIRNISSTASVMTADLNVSYILDNGVPFVSASAPGYFSFNQQQIFWSVVGLRPPAGADYDLLLYSDSAYSTLLATSLWGTNEVDFIVSDHNHSARKEYFPVAAWYGGSGPYTIEWEDSSEWLMHAAYAEPRWVSWNTNNVVKVFDVYLQAGKEYVFILDMATGSADMAMSLFRSNGTAYHAGRSQAVRQADAGGNGSDERCTYIAPTSDWYGLVVWSKNAASAGFYLSVGEITPLTHAQSQRKIDLSAYYSYDHEYPYWDVIAVRPDQGSDFDLFLYNDSTFSQLLALSTRGSHTVDLIMHDIGTRSGRFFPQVKRWSGGGGFRVEWEDSTDIILQPVTTVYWDTTRVAKAWDVLLEGGKEYIFRVSQPENYILPFGIAVFEPKTGTNFQTLGDAIAWSDTPVGANGTTTISLTPSNTGWHSFVIWGKQGPPAYLYPPLFVVEFDQVRSLVSGVAQSHNRFTKTFVYNQQAHWWSAVGIRPPSGGDFDIALYDTALLYAGGRMLAASSRSGSAVDFVVGDHNHSPLGKHYAHVNPIGFPAAQNIIQWDNGADALLPGTLGNLAWSQTDIVRIWDAYLTAGKTYKFVLSVSSGNTDFGIALFESAGLEFYAARDAATTEADQFGAGQQESFSFTASSTDWYGFVIWANNAAPGTFTIQLYELDFSLPITISDNCSHSALITLGTCSTASDGFDPGLDEYAPPPPPIGAFDARFKAGTTDYLSDFRHSISNYRVWSIHFRPTSGCSPARLSWYPGSLPPTGSFRLRDAATGQIVNIDMRATNHFNDNLNLGQLQVVYSTQTSVATPLQTGWNMVGIPVNPESRHYLSVFPSAIAGTCYGFDGTYQSLDSCEIGNGYWLRFNTPGTQTISGAYVDDASLSLRTGWNMVSGPTCSVPLSSLNDPGGILMQGTVYTYNGVYVAVDTLRPGKGYWIRARSAGTIWAGCPEMQQPSTTQLPKSSGIMGGTRLTLSDATGASQTLYISESYTQEDLLRFSLPPLPPIGSFDVRFAGDTRVCGANSAAFTLQASKYPVTLEIVDENEPLKEYLLTVSSERGVLFSQQLTSGMRVDIADPTARLFVLSRSVSIPTKFTVEQNHPNPFNPSTEIRYSIPTATHVEVTVYSILGEVVRVLVNEWQERGWHTAWWNGELNSGGIASSGVYFYRINAGIHHNTRKMVLAK